MAELNSSVGFALRLLLCLPLRLLVSGWNRACSRCNSIVCTILYRQAEQERLSDSSA